MQEKDFLKRFYAQAEFIVCTFFIPLSLLMEAMSLPYRNLASSEGLKPFYAMGILYLVEFALWVLKENQNQLKKEEVKHFETVKSMFFCYSIFAIMLSTQYLFTQSLLISFWSMMMAIGFIGKYQLLKRIT